ncbi:MAG: hypothetical protein O3C57_04860 [Verrucomicrobia bacterium]|nr:hypothetical protein [Verrucomicrobiota bacterium]
MLHPGWRKATHSPAPPQAASAYAQPHPEMRAPAAIAISSRAVILFRIAALFWGLTIYGRAQSTALTADGGVQAFLMLGPMPTAGLTMINAWGERQCAPVNGQIFRAEGWDGWWRNVEAPMGNLDILSNADRYAPIAWPPHYPDIVYLHTCLSVTTRQDTALSIDGVFSDAHVLLDGEHQKVDGHLVPLALEAGVHNLLIKCFGFQETGMPWKVRCRLLNEQGTAEHNVMLTVNPPDLAPAELQFRNHPAFRPGEAPSDRIDIRFRNSVSALATRIYPEHGNLHFHLLFHYMDDLEMLRAYGPVNFAVWTTFRGSYDIRVFDFWGMPAGTITNTLVINSGNSNGIRFTMAPLARGHYTMQIHYGTWADVCSCGVLFMTFRTRQMAVCPSSLPWYQVSATTRLNPSPSWGPVLTAFQTASLSSDGKHRLMKSEFSGHGYT